MNPANNKKISLHRRPSIRQFVKFCIVGGIAAVINFSFLYALTEWSGWWYIYSAIFGFLISAIFNFNANKFWTFKNRDRGRHALNQVFKFSLVLVAGLLINTLLIYAVTEGVGLDYRLSWVFATGVVTFWNFGFNRFWTFKVAHTISERPSDIA